MLYTIDEPAGELHIMESKGRACKNDLITNNNTVYYVCFIREFVLRVKPEATRSTTCRLYRQKSPFRSRHHTVPRHTTRSRKHHKTTHQQIWHATTVGSSSSGAFAVDHAGSKWEADYSFDVDPTNKVIDVEDCSCPGGWFCVRHTSILTYACLSGKELY